MYMKIKHGPIYTEEENKLTEQIPDEPIAIYEDPEMSQCIKDLNSSEVRHSFSGSVRLAEE